MLEYFVTVAAEQGVTRAADELMTSQSTVSSGLRSLERELGTPLFARVGRTVRLTEAGEDLLPVARRILAGVDTLRTFGGEDSGIRGRVRVGVFPGMEALTGLPRILAQYEHAHPRVDIGTFAPTRGSSGAIDDVERGRLDLAFCALPANCPEVTSIPLASYPWAAYLPPGHARAADDVVDLTALAGERWVAVLPGYGNRTQLDAFLQGLGIQRRVTTEVATLPSVPQYVEAGLGVAVIPRVVPDSGCAVRPLAQQLPSWHMQLIVTAGGMERPAVRGLVDRLVEHFARG